MQFFPNFCKSNYYIITTMRNISYIMFLTPILFHKKFSLIFWRYIIYVVHYAHII